MLALLAALAVIALLAGATRTAPLAPGLSAAPTPGAATTMHAYPMPDRLPLTRADLRIRHSVDSPGGVYMPRDLSEAVGELQEMLPPAFLRHLALDLSPTALARATRQSAPTLESLWQLSGTSTLGTWFRAFGLCDVERMWQVLLTAAAKQAAGLPWTPSGELDAGLRAAGDVGENYCGAARLVGAPPRTVEGHAGAVHRIADWVMPARRTPVVQASERAASNRLKSGPYV